MIFQESLSRSITSPYADRVSLLSTFCSDSTPTVQSLNQLWRDVFSSPLHPTTVTAEKSFISLLRRCAYKQSLLDGRRAHHGIIKQGLDRNLMVSNLLLQMYGYCGELHDATFIFELMEARDMYSWRFLIISHAKCGHAHQSFHLFCKMLGEGFLPDNAVIGSIISTCSCKDGLDALRLVHSLMTEWDINPSVSVVTSLFSMYGRSGHLVDASEVFSRLQERDVVCWNAMISAYVSKEEYVHAIRHFYEMSMEGMHPDRSTFLSVLTACAGLKAIKEGMLVHACIVDAVCEKDVSVANALVNMYGNCDSSEDAQSVFDEISVTDVVSWNVMIAAFVRNNQEEKAIRLFERMHENNVLPSNVTFIAVLSACSSPTTLEKGQLIHHFIVCNDCDSDIVIENALINMYSKCGGVGDARIVFEKSNDRDRVSWTAMLTAYAQGGQGQHAVQLFDQMEQEGVIPDRITFISATMACTCESMLARGVQIHARIISYGLINDLSLQNGLVTMYGKCGSVENAKIVFQKMQKRDLLSWNAVISACVQNEISNDALGLFREMIKEGVLPDKFICSSIMSACASSAAQDRGKEMHIFTVINGFESDLTLGNATINMYAKFGNREDAHRVFERMPKKDIVSWSAIIAAYAQHGHGNDAVALYNRMLNERISTDKIALIHLLSACSHDGLVDEALRHFLAVMLKDCDMLIIDHFNCMVDLLGRAGRLEEAEKLLLKLPFKSSAIAWTTLLGACRSQIDVVRGEYAANRIFELDPEAAAPYITLSNLYFAAGRVDDALSVIQKMREKGLVEQVDDTPIDVLREV